MHIRSALATTIALLGIVAGKDAIALPNGDPYAYDPTFNQGLVIDDRFAATTDQNQQLAQKMVRLSNGDVVVAGLVPAAFQPNQSNGAFNLGLVRYSADGSRVPWADPTPAFSYFNNMYVDYPNNNQAGYTAVRDIKAIAGYIYVLLDVTRVDGNQDVTILAVSDSGAIVGDYSAFGTTLAESGAGLATYSVPNCLGVVSCPKVIAVATYEQSSGRQIITAKRFSMGNNGAPTFTPNGTLAVDTAFGPFGNGANDYLMPDVACAAHTQCSVHAAGVAAVRTGTGTPTIYVGGDSLWSGEDRDSAVLAIDGDSGNALTSFGTGGGFSWDPIDAGGTDREVGAGIAVTQGADAAGDRIYAVSNVALPCSSSSGIGVVKVVGGSGARDLAFGSGGKLVFGGEEDPNCDTSGALSDIPYGVALDGSRLAIAGESGFVAVIFPVFGPLFSIVDATDGTVDDMYEELPSRPDGTPWGTYYLRDVISDGDGRFSATGYLIDFDPDKPLFGTTRFSSDRIFADGFD